jgi:GWxTD domain-containing protein
LDGSEEVEEQGSGEKVEGRRSNDILRTSHFALRTSHFRLEEGGGDGEAEVQRALDAFTRGYHAMHQGDLRAAREGDEAALRAFEALLRQSRKYGLSKGSCLGYVQALRSRAGLTEAEREQAVCQDRLLVLGDLFSRFAQGHGGRLPADAEGLRSWAARQVEARTPDAAVRARDLSALSQMFHCPADPDPERPISYACRPEAPGEPSPLTCLWHRGRALRLTGTPGRYGVADLGFSPDQIDSLDAVAARCLGAGEASRAVSLLEVVAHQRPGDAAAHNRLGYAALKASAHARAEGAFKRAASLARGRERARAYCGLGLIHTERSKGLYTAIGYFRDALTQDRGCVDARYQMARARYLLWEYDARADIEAVLKMDPNYAEAYLLMGNWYADLKEDCGQAILWYAKYIALRPDDPEGRRRLSAAYLKVKDYDRVLETLLSFVRERPDATEVMPIAAQACLKQEKLDMASSFYRAYISRLDPEGRALYEDIRLIASREEMAEYARASGAEREAFLKRFWGGRDPDLSTPVNERLLEHYRRVWYARQTFSKGRQPWDRRGEVYVRFGEPDHRTSSLMMNALQGLAVQRVRERVSLDLYGNRGLGETYVGSVFPVRSIAAREGRREHDALATGGGVEIAREQQTQTNTSVRSTQEEYVTRKEQRGKDTQSQLRSNNEEARLRFGDLVGSADLSRADALRGEFGERGEGFLRFGDYRPVLASDADVTRVAWESWVYTRVAGGIEVTFTDESGKGAYDYAPVPASPDVSTDQLTKFVRYAPGRVVERAIAVSPDFYAPEYDAEPFHFYFDTADFRGRAGRSALEVYCGLPRTAARYLTEEGVARLVVERHVALISAASDTVYRAGGELVYETPGDRPEKGALVPDLVRLEAPPGDYRLEVRARDRMTGRLGIYRKDTRVEAYDGEGLRLSGLELAWRISERGPADRFSKGALSVIPLPTRTYRRGQSVFVYYEIYNLAQDGDGQTSYQVEYTISPKEGGVLSRLVRTFSRKREEVAVGYEGRGFRDTEAAHVELGLKDCQPGRYTLRVAVTDLNGGRTAAKEASFAVAE